MNVWPWQIVKRSNSITDSFGSKLKASLLSHFRWWSQMSTNKHKCCCSSVRKHSRITFHWHLTECFNDHWMFRVSLFTAQKRRYGQFYLSLMSVWPETAAGSSAHHLQHAGDTLPCRLFDVVSTVHHPLVPLRGNMRHVQWPLHDMSKPKFNLE